MTQAILAAEDERFYQHPGIDTLGVLRAAYSNFVGGGKRQGASTITMQVARNFFLSSEKTLTRKLYEMLLAFKIENNLTKGPDPRDLYQPDLPRPARLRLLRRRADLLRQAAEGHQHRRGGDARRAAQGALRLQPGGQSQARHSCASAMSCAGCTN
jgi:hypothetical protein